MPIAKYQIRRRLGNTLLLIGLGQILSKNFGILLGLFSGWKQFPHPLGFYLAEI